MDYSSQRVPSLKDYYLDRTDGGRGKLEQDGIGGTHRREAFYDSQWPCEWDLESTFYQKETKKNSQHSRRTH